MRDDAHAGEQSATSSFILCAGSSAIMPKVKMMMLPKNSKMNKALKGGIKLMGSSLVGGASGGIEKAARKSTKWGKSWNGNPAMRKARSLLYQVCVFWCPFVVAASISQTTKMPRLRQWVEEI